MEESRNAAAAWTWKYRQNRDGWTRIEGRKHQELDHIYQQFQNMVKKKEKVSKKVKIRFLTARDLRDGFQ